MHATTALTGAPNCFQSSCFFSRGLIASNFGFTIPAAATITGIKLEVKRNAFAANAVYDSVVQFRLGNNLVGDNKKSSIAWTTSSVYFIYGDSASMWGYAWTPTIVNNTNFSAMVKVMNGETSIQNVAVDHIRVTVYYSLSAPPDANFTVNENTVCNCDTIFFTDLSTNAPTSWQWSFPGGNPVSSNLQNPEVLYCTVGTYDATLIASNGFGSDTFYFSNCISVDTAIVPLITQNIDTLWCVPSNYNGYQWYLDSVLLTGETNPFIPLSGMGNYSVSIIDSNGCSTMSNDFHYTIGGMAISNFSPETFIFPNPAVEWLKLKTQKIISAINISDEIGRVVYSIPESSLHDNTIDVIKFTDGVYFLRVIFSDGEISNAKFIVAH